MIFNPSALDTTAKILALGTIQCPCYTACSANFCNVRPNESLPPFVSVSYEGETFVTRDELKQVRTMRQFARKNRITVFLFIKTETRMSKREKPKTSVDTKTEKPGILSAKSEKPISKVTKTAKPKNPMSPS